MYKRGNLNLPLDALSRRRSSLHLTVLDLCARIGTVIRFLAHSVPSQVCINYIVVENNPDCRMVVERVFNLVQRNHQALFLRKDIFRLGHDSKDLINGRLPTVDLLIGGVPCQPLSKANPASKGMQGEQSLFQSVQEGIMYSKTTFYAIECAPFAKHLQAHLDNIQQWRRQSALHTLSQ